MPLTVRLSAETEHCLKELLAATGQDRSSLIRQLIRESWQRRRLLGQKLTARQAERR